MTMIIAFFFFPDLIFIGSKGFFNSERVNSSHSNVLIKDMELWKTSNFLMKET